MHVANICYWTFFWGFNFHAPIAYRIQMRIKSRPICSQLQTGTIFDPIEMFNLSLSVWLS